MAKKKLPCNACGGSGYIICSLCKGSGKVTTSNSIYKGVTTPNLSICFPCGGNGKVMCNVCAGTGYR